MILLKPGARRSRRRTGAQAKKAVGQQAPHYRTFEAVLAPSGCGRSYNRPEAAGCMAIFATLILLGAVTVGNHPPIDAVRDDLPAFVGYRLTLCGEVSADRSILYSDTVSQFHGRVGIKLRGYRSAGRSKCIVGYLVHEDDQEPPGRGYPRIMHYTDAAVQPDYVFITAGR
ncbi:hypothetical protein [Sphingomonas oligophenolica]|uniref:hypothetical protein n=1 Tax=Sphingomonas oligophenolica TaxID=301154 RepID=UPI00112DF399|nr:hypothetical protein [Sphingomonas oligophenolica]